MIRQFDQQLEKLRTKIIKMCSLVDEQVDLALKSFNEENVEFAKTVIERDSLVDKYDVKIEKACQKIIALNQPVAMDLRLILSALTINTNLERIGDIAVNLAEAAIEIKKKPDFIDRIPYYKMAATAKQMLKDSIDSLIEANPHLAQKVIKMDDELDNYDKSSYEVLLKIMKESPNNIEAGVTMLIISQQLERIGDHATNIAEDVFFIVEAQMIKHKYEKFLFGEEESEDDDKDINNEEEKPI
ncbi:MAG: phosphate signaling complex protein PhoU [Syntrophothermus sp.]